MRVGKLTESNMQSTSFTISSLSSVDTTSFTSIINASKVVIIDGFLLINKSNMEC
ncbi:MAG: 2-oxo acid dehydrogenase subunit E2 [Arsenophonus sp. NC-QC1-MAG3]